MFVTEFNVINEWLENNLNQLLNYVQNRTEKALKVFNPYIVWGSEFTLWVNL